MALSSIETGYFATRNAATLSSYMFRAYLNIFELNLLETSD